MVARRAPSPPHTRGVSRNLNAAPSSIGGDSNTGHLNDGSLSDATSCISSAGDGTIGVRESDVDQEPSTTLRNIPQPPPGSYYGCYYPGYTYLGAPDSQKYHPGDGTEIQFPALQADNGSFIYYMPGYQPDNNPYSYCPFLPVPPGVDGQYATHNHVFPSIIASTEFVPTLVPYGSELLMTCPQWDSSYLYGNIGHGGGYNSFPDTLASKANLPDHSHRNRGSTESSNVSSVPGHFNQLKPAKKAFQPNQINESGPLLEKNGFIGPTTPVNIVVNGRDWGGAGKFKTCSNNATSNPDMLDCQKESVRKIDSDGAFVSGENVVGAVASSEDGPRNRISFAIKRDHYNLPDFQTDFDHALFFVIKSYSEDDIHKSIKYNVWASTSNGNKRLNGAYIDAQRKMCETGIKCPVFLFFSVNASGQFCGVAEMIGQVDFSRRMNFWQQDKWNGFFPVKWHMIKDVPNPQLRHVILPNNENKPITSSRDTQEIRFPQGVEMLKVFKIYVSKTSILDDFDFYERREKVLQNGRVRHMPHADHHKGVYDVVSKIHSISLSPVDKIAEPEKIRE